MCLRKIVHVYDPPLKESRIGYKVFEEYDDELRALYFSCSFDLDGWNIDKETDNIVGTLGIIYPSGYHVYKNLKDISFYTIEHSPDDLVVYKVEIQDIVAYGTNTSFGKVGLSHCYVAKKLRLIEQVNEI
mgnify:CR=1 FL=1